MLKIEKISKKYNNSLVLEDIDIAIENGQILCLMGHNGSGKSTLLKILWGEILPTNGNFYGIDQKTLGIVFEHKSLDEKLSLYENLLYGARLYGVTSKEPIKNALKMAELYERKDDLVTKLSLGMRRSLELYRAFMHKPKILLLDEPTTGLDVYAKEKFYEFLKTYIKAENAIAIFSSHGAKDGLYADTLVMMKKGKIIKKEEPKKLLNDLNFIRVKIYEKNQYYFNEIPVFERDTLISLIREKEKTMEKIVIEKPDLRDVYKFYADDHFDVDTKGI